MNRSERGLTLVEVIACAVLLGFVTAVSTGIQEKLNEDARNAKCQSNLKRQITAVLAYVDDYDGVLPGPVHPAIKRLIHNIEGANPDADHRKSLTWLLRPYFPVVGDSITNPATANPIVDEVFHCPTATMITPDAEALGWVPWCTEERPFNYVCNSWGPIATPGTIFQSNGTEWHSTDPPHYFGTWYYCDASPQRADICWKPKALDSIPNPEAEWATADAWYRRIPPGSPRGGSRREFLGTYAPHADFLYPTIPSAPYHGVSGSSALSTLRWRVPVLPDIPLEGSTNMSFFDGHVAPFKGDWKTPGDGGTVNPYWQSHGGLHPTSQPWDPASCNQAAP